MKKLITLIAIIALFAPLSISAQGAKKYVLVEHFTNTNCGICGFTNPDFFNRVAVETNKNMHHISIHSSIPYSSCVFYQANKTEQDARATFYNLPGTPRASLNGAALVSAANITAASITDAATGTSTLEVKVTETTGSSRTATVKLKSVGTVPVGPYKFYAAVIEKKVSYNAPNGEATHYNVFRKFIANGTDVTLGANGTELTYNLNYTIDAAWKTEVYVVAFVQNATTKAVLNSGTRFDVVSSIEEPSIDAQVSVSPNPTNGALNVQINHKNAQTEILEMLVTNIAGQVIENVTNLKSNSYNLDLNAHPKGIYFLKVKSTEGVATKKIVLSK